MRLKLNIFQRISLHERVRASLRFSSLTSFWVVLHDFDVRKREHLLRENRVIVLVVYDADDASLDDHLGAKLAGE